MVNHEKNHLGKICLHLKQTQDGSPTYTNLVFVYMGVSKNGGTPKWMVYNRKTLLKCIILWGENPLFSETPILPSLTLLFCCLMESSLGLTLVSANQQKKTTLRTQKCLANKKSVVVRSPNGKKTTTYTPEN